MKKVPASDEAEVHRLRSVYNFHFIATKRPDFESATSDQLAEFRILRINKGVSFESALFEAMAKDKVFDNRYKMDYSRPSVRNLKNGSATRALNLLGKGNSKLFNHFGITNVEYTVDDKSTRKNKRTGDDRFKFVRVTKLLPLINDSFTPKKIGENEKGEKLYEQTFDLDDLERVLIDDSNWDEAGNFKIIPVMIEGELKNLRMRLQLSIRSKTFTQTIEGEVLTEEGKAERVSYYFPDMNFKSDNTSSTIDEFPVEFSLTHNVSSLEPTNVSWIANKDVDELVSEFNKAETAETQNPVEEKQDTERRKQALRDLMQTTGDETFILGTEDGTFAGDGLLNMNENGDVVLTRFTDSEENLTKGKGKTENLANIAGQFGGEQIATSGVEGGLQSFTNGVIGEYHIPLQDLS